MDILFKSLPRFLFSLSLVYALVEAPEGTLMVSVGPEKSMSECDQVPG